jgi:hypothetical protein
VFHQTIVSACQCEGCKGYTLVVGERAGPQHSALGQFKLVAVYPTGEPDDHVAEEVVQAAKGVADDFSEALRCHWVKAFKACVVMCARAIQGSAIALGAKKKKLTDQIGCECRLMASVNENALGRPSLNGQRQISSDQATPLPPTCNSFWHSCTVRK